MRYGVDGTGLAGKTEASTLQQLLAAYQLAVSPTDFLPKHQLGPAATGLYREVGDVLTIRNKRKHFTTVCPRLQGQLKEELADVLWYFSALARRLGTDIGRLIMDAGPTAPNTQAQHACALQVDVVRSARQMDINARLGQAAANLLLARGLDDFAREALRSFGKAFRQAVEASGIALEDIVHFGAQKARHGYLLPALEKLPRFDVGFPDDQRLPESFQIQFVKKVDGRCQMIWDGKPIGDPLNDSSEKVDGYRFHDVFHLAHVAVLNWSPAFRSIAGLKRKSNPRIDDAQDGGRAQVVEEGIVAWIFGRAKAAGFFQIHRKVAYSQLKTITQFVHGLEVEQCPPRLWERAILAGCDVFSAVRRNRGGVVIGHLGRRTLLYRIHAEQPNTP